VYSLGRRIIEEVPDISIPDFDDMLRISSNSKKSKDLKKSIAEEDTDDKKIKIEPKVYNDCDVNYKR
jgi:hypothetical protein